MVQHPRMDGGVSYGATAFQTVNGSYDSRRQDALGSGSDPRNEITFGLYACGYRDCKTFLWCICLVALTVKSPFRHRATFKRLTLRSQIVLLAKPPLLRELASRYIVTPSMFVNVIILQTTRSWGICTVRFWGETSVAFGRSSACLKRLSPKRPTCIGRTSAALSALNTTCPSTVWFASQKPSVENHTNSSSEPDRVVLQSPVQHSVKRHDLCVAEGACKRSGALIGCGTLLEGRVVQLARTHGSHP